MTFAENAAEAVFDDLWTYKEAGEFDRSIEVLQGLGYAATVTDFVLNPDSYYFPNRRGNHFIKPHAVSDDKIPVVVMKRGETAVFETPTLHSYQREALAASFSHWTARDADKFLATATNLLYSSGGQEGTASNYTRLVKVRDIQNGLVESKPVIIFNAGETISERTKFCAGVAMHELVHVAQSLNDPVRRPAQNLQRELEAYSVQSQLLYAANHELYSLGTAMACEVEKFRKEYLGNSYEPTDFFIAELRKDPLLVKILK